MKYKTDMKKGAKKRRVNDVVLEEKKDLLYLRIDVNKEGLKPPFFVSKSAQEVLGAYQAACEKYNVRLNFKTINKITEYNNKKAVAK